MFLGNSGDEMNTRIQFLRLGAAIGALTIAVGLAPVSFAQTSSVAPTTIAATLSPAGEAIKAELIRRLGATSPAIAAYAQRGFAPIWLDEDGRSTERASALVAALARAPNHALPAKRYDAAGLANRLAAGGFGLEADLTAAFLRFGRDITSGALEPRDIDDELVIDPRRPNPAKLIADAGAAQNLVAFLDSLAPGHPNYKGLVAKYAAFRTFPADAWGKPVPKGRTLRPGIRHQRIGPLRDRLIAMGDLDPRAYSSAALGADGERVAANDVTTDVNASSPDRIMYDPIMVDAVKRFQKRHGLNTDGMIGPATLDQINASPADRARQIAVNLERLRWLNRDLGKRHILVNLAGFTMAVIEGNREIFTSRVVVGKASKHRTPEFSDEMTHMVINPSWNVPRSIATKEILPILKRDPSYLSRKNMRLVGGSAPEDWSTVTASTFPGRIVQKPGGGNALGTVKFMFPNKYAIYLHDTPSKRLFRRDVRAYSHGCVRVERPVDFAEFLLTGQVDDPRGYFHSVRKQGRERQVNLDNPLQVHLTYRTAWRDNDGTYQFRGDIYGRDAKVARALSQAGVSILQ